MRLLYHYQWANETVNTIGAYSSQAETLLELYVRTYVYFLEF